MSDVAKRNLDHAIENSCTDPDCEIHRPEVIEGDAERLTAKAWFYAGACALVDQMEKIDLGRDENPVPMAPSQLIEEAMAMLQEKHIIHNNWP